MYFSQKNYTYHHYSIKLSSACLAVVSFDVYTAHSENVKVF